MSFAVEMMAHAAGTILASLGPDQVDQSGWRPLVCGLAEQRIQNDCTVLIGRRMLLILQKAMYVSASERR